MTRRWTRRRTMLAASSTPGRSANGRRRRASLSRLPAPSFDVMRYPWIEGVRAARSKTRPLGAAAADEHQEAAGEDGRYARNVGDRDAVLLLGGRRQRADVQDLLFGRVGEPTQHEARDSKNDQHDTDDRNRFHFPHRKVT